MSHRSHWKIAALVLAVLAAGVQPPVAAGDDKTANEKTGEAAATSALQDALSAEQLGKNADRGRRLRSVLQQTPDFAPARWQSGEVRIGDRWLTVDRATKLLAGDETLAEYRRVRAATPDTVAGHIELASWCKQHELPDHRRAHLTAVLETQPNHKAARRALGFVRVGPFWYSKRELAANEKLAKQTLKDVRRWAPTVHAIREGLTSGKPGRYKQALAKLKSIDDPSAVPAIEFGLAYHSPQLAMLVVDYLGEKSTQAATMGLTRQGLFSPWPTPRKAAAKKLKPRKFEHFVPQVLELTSTPVVALRMLGISRDGSVRLRQVFRNETRGLELLNVIDSGNVYRFVPVRIVGTGLAQTSFPRALRTRNAAERMDFATALAFGMMWNSQTDLQDRNRMIQRQNTIAAELLATISGRPFEDDVQTWWSWWGEYQDVEIPEEKQTVLKIQSEVTQTAVPDYQFSSCLAAGTPVWTERGPVAVEKIEVGDRVLSKNVETGELAYKPVLKTTVRGPVEQMKLSLGSRTISVTRGHVFWISGKGWMKARDVKPGMLMHDVSGATEVRPLGEAPNAKAYNLVVADFHNYFVGEAKVLSHDNTPIQPTDVLVPGLARK